MAKTNQRYILVQQLRQLVLMYLPDNSSVEGMLCSLLDSFLVLLIYRFLLCNLLSLKFLLVSIFQQVIAFLLVIQVQQHLRSNLHYIAFILYHIQLLLHLSQYLLDK